MKAKNQKSHYFSNLKIVMKNYVSALKFNIQYLDKNQNFFNFPFLELQIKTHFPFTDFNNS